MKSIVNKLYNNFVAILIGTLLMGALFTSCGENNDVIPPIDPPGGEINDSTDLESTLLMYFPWSGNLTSFFRKNIEDMEQSIAETGLNDQRVLVFFASAPADAILFEFKKDDTGKIVRDTISSYPAHPYTTVEGLSKMLNDVKELAPAKKYSLMIGAHGMAWLPVSRASSLLYSTGKEDKFIEHWNVDIDDENAIRTRYFGGTSAAYQTDISTLVDALEQTDTHLQYILFDDCFMSSIEVAYELRNSADYLIASTCEIMDYGMPYHKIGKYLLGEPDYENIVAEFYNFYSTYSRMPCGTIGVTSLKEMDAMAIVMSEINTVLADSIPTLNSKDIQTFDGYSPTLFFDYGHYVETLCKESYPELYERFTEQLNLTVPYKTATNTYYSMSSGRQHKIDNYSGINTSEPSTNSQSTKHYKQTPWYKATHKY